jgi:RNA polymerase sigma-70 factor (ECF subfamily)
VRNGQGRQRFEAYQGRLYGFALAISRDREVAAELLQDCIVRAMSARRVPEDENAYRAWLFTILRNLWRDHRRASCREEPLELEDVAEMDLTLQPVEQIVVNAVAVHQAFDRLASDHRDILAVVDVGGFSYGEAARILGIPEGTVMSRVSRARAALAALLRDDHVLQLQHQTRRGRT